MGYVIAIFRFIVDGLALFLRFITGIPGMVISCVTGIGVAITAFAQNVFNSGRLVIEILDKGREAVNGMMGVLQGVEYFGFFHHMFAFDVLGKVFSSFVVLVMGLMVVAVFDVFFSGVVVAVPFFCLKVLRSLVSVCSAGFAKP